MGRKEDLEQHIRESYKLVREFEEILRLSENPTEIARSKRAIGKQQELIRRYLEDYISLHESLNFAIPQDIFEIAIIFGVSLPPSEPYDGEEDVQNLLQEVQTLLDQDSLDEAIKLLRRARSISSVAEEANLLYLEAVYRKGVRLYVTDRKLHQARRAFLEVVQIDWDYKDATRLLDEVEEQLRRETFIRQSLGRAREALRDPVWQGVGAIIAILALAIAFGSWFWPDIRTALFPSPTVVVVTTPSPTSTPTATPTGTPSPTPTPTPVCPYQAATDHATIIQLIQAEALAVNLESVYADRAMSIIEAIFAKDAFIRDEVNGDEWHNPKKHYEGLFASTDFIELEHFDILPAGPGITGIIAYYTSGNKGQYRVGGGEWQPLFNGSTLDRLGPATQYGSDHWTLKRNSLGCWEIVELRFNAGHIEFPP